MQIHKIQNKEKFKQCFY